MLMNARQLKISLTLRSMANVGGLEGCKPSNTSCSRAAEAQPPPHGNKGILGRRPEGTRPPQTPPLRKVRYHILVYFWDSNETQLPQQILHYRVPRAKSNDQLKASMYRTAYVFKEFSLAPTIDQAVLMER